MTKHFTVNQYRSNENTISAVADILKQQAKNLITNKIHVLPQRWKNWADRKRGYVNKSTAHLVIFHVSNLARLRTFQFSSIDMLIL